MDELCKGMVTLVEFKGDLALYTERVQQLMLSGMHQLITTQDNKVVLGTNNRIVGQLTGADERDLIHALTELQKVVTESVAIKNFYLPDNYFLVMVAYAE